MAIAQSDKPARRKPLRLWPGVVAALLLWLVWSVVPRVVPEAGLFGVMGGLVGALVILVWWAFFSRAPHLERWGAVLLMVVALVATSRVLHVSIADAGMGMLFPFYAIPLLCLVFVGWAVATRRLSDGARRASMVATILLVTGGWTLIRSDGITMSTFEVAWRWSATAEERLLARGDDDPATHPAVAAPTESGADWPGFRGRERDGVVPGVRIETDWSASPPEQLWRRPIGPGCSSFAVRGNLLYTQEQRGDDEIVACYHVATGEPVWRHRDAVRFWDSHVGAGPRGTPAVHEGRVYTLGATGILNALDAGDGSVAWSRDVASDSGIEVPYWGFASSPLVVDDDVVIVAAAGRLVGYDLATGELRWLGPEGGNSYSSPHLMTVDGVAQVLLLSTTGTASVAPADGSVLWEHPWRAPFIVQPARTADGDILISTIGANSGKGIRRLSVAHGPDGWATKERWTSAGLKPYFNDFVVHEGHAYGFDGRILACIDLADGERRWKGGRYGNGQLLALADQDLLLVVSERGELALVRATPDRFEEIARFPAIEGKTWNHPALVGDLLLVRNGEEMAAFRLPLAG